MALTSTQQRDLIKVGVGLFGAALGSNYLNEFANAINSGSTVSDIYKAVMNSPFIQASDLYPSYLTSTQFATRFVDALAGTTTLTADNRAQAIALIAGQLDTAVGTKTGKAANDARATVVEGIINALDSLANGGTTTGDAALVAAYGPLALAFDNRVSVAMYYSINMGAGTSSTSLATLQSVITGVTDTTPLSTDALIQNYINNTPAGAAAGQTYTLTTGVDTVTGKGGNDSFIANSTDSKAQTLSAFDDLNGGAGQDTLSLISTTGAAVTVPTTAKVSNIEIANLTADAAVSVNAAGWTGLTTLNVFSTGGATVTAASGTSGAAVKVTDSQLNGGTVTINGGTDVTVGLTDKAGSASINVGTTTAATGAVNVTLATTSNVSAGTINVTGGKTVSITTTQANAVNTTATNAAVNVTGTADTTKVDIKSAAAKTQSGTVAGVNANSVAIIDVNGGGASTTAGTIKSISINGYTTVGISGNAVETLSLANGSGNVIIDNSSSLKTVTNKTLGLTVDGLTGGTLDDADIYTTLNVTTTGTASKLANVTFGGVTALTVDGTKGLTLTSTAGLGALTTVTVKGSAGITADLSGAKITSVDASATSGANKVTVDASKATFTGGTGADTVTLSATAPTKAISLGDGDDSLDMSAATATPTAAIKGGAGTDSLTTTAAQAATASADSKFAGIVSEFERLTLTGSTNQTIDLAVLGNFNHVTTSGGNGLTLNNIKTDGTLVLNGAGTAYTLANSAFTAATDDKINITLTDGSGAAVAFASTGITAANVETIAITTADTQATPSGSFLDTLTLLGNTAKTITVAGNAGLSLTATSTALTSVDASGITLGGFTWTAGALAGASTVKGSATGTNTVVATAATAAVTYTGGTGNDVVTINNAKNNSVTLGDGDNSFTGGAGNNTVTAGKGADTVTVTSGNNTVTLGDGANAFTATSGTNTYVGGAGVDTVTLGGGLNTVTLGAGKDVLNLTAASANVNTYTTIVDPAAGDTINLIDKGTEVFGSTKVTLAGTAVFQDYANAVIQAGGNAATNGYIGWFQFGGDTYIVESMHDGSGVNASFVNGTDLVVKLTGLVDLSTATITGNSVLLA